MYFVNRHSLMLLKNFDNQVKIFVNSLDCKSGPVLLSFQIHCLELKIFYCHFRTCTAAT